MRKLFLKIVAAASLLSLPHPALAAVAPDPEGSGVIIGAVNWLQGTLLGTVATVAELP